MLNNVVLQGRFTRKPELRRTSTGVAVTSFALAVDRDFANKETGEKGCDFIDCVAWRGTADFIDKYMDKGTAVVVSGRIEMRTYTDKDGNNRKAVEVNVSNIYFAGGKAAKGDQAGSDVDAAPTTFTEITDEDSDLPF